MLTLHHDQVGGMIQNLCHILATWHMLTPQASGETGREIKLPLSITFSAANLVNKSENNSANTLLFALSESA